MYITRTAHPAFFFVFVALCSMVHADTPVSPEQIYQQTLRGTVLIRAKRNHQEYFGTGWIYDKHLRLIVTNRHVVIGANVEVLFPEFQHGRLVSDREHYMKYVRPNQATIVDSDISNDLAIVQVDDIPGHMNSLAMAKQSAHPASKVHAIGAAPVGNSGVFVYTNGDVRQVQTGPVATGYRTRTIETTLDANYGNSGGAMVNSLGEVVGVISSYGTVRNQIVSNVVIGVDVEATRQYISNVLTLQNGANADQLNTLGGRHYWEGRYAKALELYSKAVRVTPNARGYTNRGWALWGLKDYATSLADFDRGLELDPNSANALEGRAYVLGQLGRNDEALADFTAAIAIEPTANRYAARAAAFAKQHQHELAIADLNRSLTMQPNAIQVLHQRGLTYVSLGKYEDAFRDATQIARFQPNNANAINLMGICHFHTDKLSLAAEAFMKAAQLAPHVAIFRSNVGDAMTRLNQPGRALEWYESALAVDPNLAAAKKGKQTIIEWRPAERQNVVKVSHNSPLIGTWSLTTKKGLPFSAVYMTFDRAGRYHAKYQTRLTNGTVNEERFSGSYQIDERVLTVQRDGYASEQTKFLILNGCWYSFDLKGNPTHTFQRVS